ncbi:MAG: disulfide bond formation protein B [Gammaproteobacteria bacterium]|jgi:protein dithiol:quinone oxidoreductase|nr:disulfide bond formation protein B [Gammaproteobacteria bacterium]
MSTISLPSNRVMNIGIFLVTVLTIAIALYMEHVMLLSPCGLCITQRVFFILCGVVCLAAALANPAATTQKFMSLVAASMCVFGSYFSIRQIWLQNLPEDEVPACGPGLTYIMDNFPFMETLNFLLKGDGNCAEVVFRLFGIFSIPQMALIAFTGLFSLCLFMAFRKSAA